MPTSTKRRDRQSQAGARPKPASADQSIREQAYAYIRRKIASGAFSRDLPEAFPFEANSK